MYLLGIDLGTTGCKSMVFDANGNILGSSYIEYDLIISSEGIEQDSTAWWENVVLTVRESVEQSGVLSSEIAALSVSSQGIAFVPIDQKGKALQNAISWLDGRATAEAAQIEKDCDKKELFFLTGKRVHPCYVLPQLMWMKRHRPENYEQTDKVLMAHDYIVYRMTGKCVTDLSMASGTLMYDIHNKRWMPELLEQFEIDANKLPELMVTGDVIGRLLPDAAEQLGLSCETIVAAGAQDQRCASVGAGIGSGIFTVSLGTSSAIGAITDKPLIDPAMQVTCCGLDRSRWILETVVSTAGVALKWLKNNLFPNLSYDEMTELAAASQPLCGGIFFYPHMSKDTSGRAMGSITGLSLQTTSKEIIRSVLEGVAFQIKLHIGSMERLGVRGDEIRLFGGGSLSGLWCQIISDATGKRVVVPHTNETANLGAAMSAGIGAGIFTNFDSAYQAMAKETKRVYYPNPFNRELYEKAFLEYQRHNENITKGC